MHRIHIGLAIRHDGHGADPNQLLYPGADIAQPQMVGRAFESEDGAAGQVVGQGFKPQLGIFALGQILHRAADADDVAIGIAVGLAANGGREGPTHRVAVCHIQRV